MAFTYGFFNSINSDRLYNADDFNNFLEGIISQNGVFEHLDDAFQVTAGSAGGLVVNLGAGKAMVNSRWIRSDSNEIIPISPADSLLDRYDAITLLWSDTNRTITVEVKQGTPSSSPVYPTPIQEASVYEIVLAYIHVRAGATRILTSDIIDTRMDTNLCGFIRSLL